MEQTKRCSDCKQEKPHSQFNKSALKKDGIRSECKDCSRKRSVGYRERIKEVNTTLVIDHKVCACCNIDKPASDFYKHIGHWDGLSHFCKECFKIDYANRYESDPDKILKRCAEYRENNPETRKETLRTYGQSPKGRVTHFRSKHTRRTREKESEITLTPKQWEKKLKEQNYKCAGFPHGSCNVAFDKDNKATQDHIIPLSLKGGLTYENTQALCTKCNCSKRDSLDRSLLISWNHID
jgi:hypothetical protein